ncbi:MAG TPA: hypothetical protein VKB79_23255 [Bryobacteraceae bacterium]|nr:hypothetical protein [Bryobacteraceae bacterium]
MHFPHVLPLITILLLGAFHGINPGMGWLFAVALGMQERRLAAVWRALIPLTLGHALAIAMVILVAVAAGVAAPTASLKLPVAVTLGALGIYRLVRHSHFTGGGMRVGMGGLTVWSFLMATCHGAGLMVLPVFLGMAAPAHGASCHAAGAASASAASAATATLAHGVGYLLVTAVVAWLVFEKVGVGILRKAWFNLDLVWAVVLIATGVLTAVL